MQFHLDLELQPLRVSTSLEKRCGGDESGIVRVISELVNLSDYGAIEKAPGGFIFPVS